MDDAPEAPQQHPGVPNPSPDVREWQSAAAARARDEMLRQRLRSLALDYSRARTAPLAEGDALCWRKGMRNLPMLPYGHPAVVLRVIQPPLAEPAACACAISGQRSLHARYRGRPCASCAAARAARAAPVGLSPPGAVLEDPPWAREPASARPARRPDPSSASSDGPLWRETLDLFVATLAPAPSLAGPAGAQALGLPVAQAGLPGQQQQASAVSEWAMVPMYCDSRRMQAIVPPDPAAVLRAMALELSRGPAGGVRRVGSVVAWRDGFRNRRDPAYGAPAVVVEVLERPVVISERWSSFNPQVAAACVPPLDRHARGQLQQQRRDLRPIESLVSGRVEALTSDVLGVTPADAVDIPTRPPAQMMMAGQQQQSVEPLPPDSGNARWREVVDVRLATLYPSGEIVIRHYDSRRFRPWF
eukprot:m51a1_g1962 hypothetical protein (417) ;mRNA; r:1072850-1074100